jgi:hypothetical protein
MAHSAQVLITGGGASLIDTASWLGWLGWLSSTILWRLNSTGHSSWIQLETWSAMNTTSFSTLEEAFITVIRTLWEIWSSNGVTIGSSWHTSTWLTVVVVLMSDTSLLTSMHLELGVFTRALLTSHRSGLTVIEVHNSTVLTTLEHWWSLWALLNISSADTVWFRIDRHWLS